MKLEIFTGIIRCNMTTLLSTVRYLCSLKKYDDALEILHETEKKIILSPELLVLKGICIQLGTPKEQYQLLDAETAFRNAIAIDNQFLEAWIELGWFYLNVKDDAINATPFFQKAVEISHKRIAQTENNSEIDYEQTTEAVIGKARCLIETASIEEALKFLKQNSLQTFLNREKIKAEERKIIEEA